MDRKTLRLTGSVEFCTLLMWNLLIVFFQHLYYWNSKILK